MRDIFVIDDTGSPGNSSQSKMLRSDRYTFLAVLIPAIIRYEISKKISDLISKYSALGIKEFHFTDLLNRRKEYQSLDTKTVQLIFTEFADLLGPHQLPVFVQTMTSRSYAEAGLNGDGKLSVPEKALLFTILRIYGFTKEFKRLRNFEIICDEGVEKQGIHRPYDRLIDLTDKPYITFLASHSDPLLQVADYYAFFFNRLQLLSIKPKRTEFDKWLINLSSRIFTGHQSGFAPGLLGVNDGAVEYDQFVLNRYKDLGSYEYWKRLNENQ